MPTKRTAIKVVVHVTAADIASSHRDDLKSNPLVPAFQRVIAQRAFLRIQPRAYLVPPRVVAIMRDFRAGKPIKPFQCTLTGII